MPTIQEVQRESEIYSKKDVDALISNALASIDFTKLEEAKEQLKTLKEKFGAETDEEKKEISEVPIMKEDNVAKEAVIPEIKPIAVCPLVEEKEDTQFQEYEVTSESRTFALALKRRMLKTQLCQYHKNGICKYAENCSYAHGQEELREKPDIKDIPSEFQFKNGNRPKIDKLCFRYLDGFCPFGEQCHYKHEKVMQEVEEKKRLERLVKNVPQIKPRAYPRERNTGTFTRQNIVPKTAKVPNYPTPIPIVTPESYYPTQPKRTASLSTASTLYEEELRVEARRLAYARAAEYSRMSTRRPEYPSQYYDDSEYPPQYYPKSTWEDRRY